MKRRFYHCLFFIGLYLLPGQLLYGQQTTPASALRDYLQNGDTTFQFQLRDSFTVAGLRAYDFLLVSQKWRQYVWKHQLTVFSPLQNDYDGALLYIVGGHNAKGSSQPDWHDSTDVLARRLAGMAARHHALVVLLRQVPNEPLFNGLVEDQIISYTFHQYQLHRQDYSWPLLFPMVKTAVRAMDAVQLFAARRLAHPVHRFIVTGASKRGWTTWLTGAADSRVAAIAPQVIDVVNMPVCLVHQMKAYGGYSVEIQDYVNLGIVQGMDSPSGKALVQMIDPYSYRAQLALPKLIAIGTNDPYWVIDNVKNYLPGLPGYHALNYTPNAGHDLDDGRVFFPALDAFFGSILQRAGFPDCQWTVHPEAKGLQLVVDASSDQLIGAEVWSAHAPGKDFRKAEFQRKTISDSSHIALFEPYPETGYLAFYVALTYRNPHGKPYQVCTRAFMLGEKGLL